MNTTIFKSEKEAKVYKIVSAKDQGIYKAGEFIRNVKTDRIELLNVGSKYELIVTEVE